MALDQIINIYLLESLLLIHSIATSPGPVVDNKIEKDHDEPMKALSDLLETVPIHERITYLNYKNENPTLILRKSFPEITEFNILPISHNPLNPEVIYQSSDADISSRIQNSNERHSRNQHCPCYREVRESFAKELATSLLDSFTPEDVSNIYFNSLGTSDRVPASILRELMHNLTVNLSHADKMLLETKLSHLRPVVDTPPLSNAFKTSRDISTFNSANIKDANLPITGNMIFMDDTGEVQDMIESEDSNLNTYFSTSENKVEDSITTDQSLLTSPKMESEGEENKTQENINEEPVSGSGEPSDGSKGFTEEAIIDTNRDNDEESGNGDEKPIEIELNEGSPEDQPDSSDIVFSPEEGLPQIQEDSEIETDEELPDDQPISLDISKLPSKSLDTLPSKTKEDSEIKPDVKLREDHPDSLDVFKFQKEGVDTLPSQSLEDSEIKTDKESRVEPQDDGVLKKKKKKKKRNRDKEQFQGAIDNDLSVLQYENPEMRPNQTAVLSDDINRRKRPQQPNYVEPPFQTPGSPLDQLKRRKKKKGPPWLKTPNYLKLPLQVPEGPEGQLSNQDSDLYKGYKPQRNRNKWKQTGYFPTSPEYARKLNRPQYPRYGYNLPFDVPANAYLSPESIQSNLYHKYIPDPTQRPHRPHRIAYGYQPGTKPSKLPTVPHRGSDGTKFSILNNNLPNTGQNKWKKPIRQRDMLEESGDNFPQYQHIDNLTKKPRKRQKKKKVNAQRENFNMLQPGWKNIPNFMIYPDLNTYSSQYPSVFGDQLGYVNQIMPVFGDSVQKMKGDVGRRKKNLRRQEERDTDINSLKFTSVEGSPIDYHLVSDEEPKSGVENPKDAIEKPKLASEEPIIVNEGFIAEKQMDTNQEPLIEESDSTNVNKKPTVGVNINRRKIPSLGIGDIVNNRKKRRRKPQKQRKNKKVLQPGQLSVPGLMTYPNLDRFPSQYHFDAQSGDINKHTSDIDNSVRKKKKAEKKRKKNIIRPEEMLTDVNLLQFSPVENSVKTVKLQSELYGKPDDENQEPNLGMNEPIIDNELLVDGSGNAPDDNEALITEEKDISGANKEPTDNKGPVGGDEELLDDIKLSEGAQAVGELNVSEEDNGVIKKKKKERKRRRKRKRNRYPQQTPETDQTKGAVDRKIIPQKPHIPDYLQLPFDTSEYAMGLLAVPGTDMSKKRKTSTLFKNRKPHKLQKKKKVGIRVENANYILEPGQTNMPEVADNAKLNTLQWNTPKGPVDQITNIQLGLDKTNHLSNGSELADYSDKTAITPEFTENKFDLKHNPNLEQKPYPFKATIGHTPRVDNISEDNRDSKDFDTEKRKQPGRWSKKGKRIREGPDESKGSYPNSQDGELPSEEENLNAVLQYGEPSRPKYTLAESIDDGSKAPTDLSYNNAVTPEDNGDSTHFDTKKRRKPDRWRKKIKKIREKPEGSGGTYPESQKVGLPSEEEALTDLSDKTATTTELTEDKFELNHSPGLGQELYPSEAAIGNIPDLDNTPEDNGDSTNFDTNKRKRPDRWRKKESQGVEEENVNEMLNYELPSQPKHTVGESIDDSSKPPIHVFDGTTILPKFTEDRIDQRKEPYAFEHDNDGTTKHKRPNRRRKKGNKLRIRPEEDGFVYPQSQKAELPNFPYGPNGANRPVIDAENDLSIFNRKEPKNDTTKGQDGIVQEENLADMSQYGQPDLSKFGISTPADSSPNYYEVDGALFKKRKIKKHEKVKKGEKKRPYLQEIIKPNDYATRPQYPAYKPKRPNGETPFLPDNIGGDQESEQSVPTKPLPISTKAIEGFLELLTQQVQNLNASKLLSTVPINLLPILVGNANSNLMNLLVNVVSKLQNVKPEQELRNVLQRLIANETGNQSPNRKYTESSLENINTEKQSDDYLFIDELDSVKPVLKPLPISRQALKSFFELVEQQLQTVSPSELLSAIPFDLLLKLRSEPNSNLMNLLVNMVSKQQNIKPGNELRNMLQVLLAKEIRTRLLTGTTNDKIDLNKVLFKTRQPKLINATETINKNEIFYNSDGEHSTPYNVTDTDLKNIVMKDDSEITEVLKSQNKTKLEMLYEDDSQTKKKAKPTKNDKDNETPSNIDETGHQGFESIYLDADSELSETQKTQSGSEFEIMYEDALQTKRKRRKKKTKTKHPKRSDKELNVDSDSELTETKKAQNGSQIEIMHEEQKVKKNSEDIDLKTDSEISEATKTLDRSKLEMIYGDYLQKKTSPDDSEKIDLGTDSEISETMKASDETKVEMIYEDALQAKEREKLPDDSENIDLDADSEMDGLQTKKRKKSKKGENIDLNTDSDISETTKIPNASNIEMIQNDGLETRKQKKAEKHDEYIDSEPSEESIDAERNSKDIDSDTDSEISETVKTSNGTKVEMIYEDALQMKKRKKARKRDQGIHSDYEVEETDESKDELGNISSDTDSEILETTKTSNGSKAKMIYQDGLQVKKRKRARRRNRRINSESPEETNTGERDLENIDLDTNSEISETTKTSDKSKVEMIYEDALQTKRRRKAPEHYQGSDTESTEEIKNAYNKGKVEFMYENALQIFKKTKSQAGTIPLNKGRDKAAQVGITYEDDLQTNEQDISKKDNKNLNIDYELSQTKRASNGSKMQIMYEDALELTKRKVPTKKDTEDTDFDDINIDDDYEISERKDARNENRVELTYEDGVLVKQRKTQKQGTQKIKDDAPLKGARYPKRPYNHFNFISTQQKRHRNPTNTDSEENSYQQLQFNVPQTENLEENESYLPQPAVEKINQNRSDKNNGTNSADTNVDIEYGGKLPRLQRKRWKGLKKELTPDYGLGMWKLKPKVNEKVPVGVSNQIKYEADRYQNEPNVMTSIIENKSSDQRNLDKLFRSARPLLYRKRKRKSKTGGVSGKKIPNNFSYREKIGKISSFPIELISGHPSMYNDEMPKSGNQPSGSEGIYTLLSNPSNYKGYPNRAQVPDADDDHEPTDHMEPTPYNPRHKSRQSLPLKYYPNVMSVKNYIPAYISPQNPMKAEAIYKSQLGTLSSDKDPLTYKGAKIKIIE